MKVIHLIVYLLINLSAALLLGSFKLNWVAEALGLVAVNFFIIYIMQKQIVQEISYMPDIFLKVNGPNPENLKIQQAGYTSEMKTIIKKFELLRNEMINDSREKQKPLTTSIEAILNSTLDGIIVVNNERDIIMANDSFFRLCGYRAYEISGKNSTSMISPENVLSKNLVRFIKYSFDNTSLNADNISTGIIEITHVKPKRILRATATPLRYNPESLDGLVINLKDITKELEAEEEKNKFISGISHEFRTPLFSITGFASLILSDPEIDQQTLRNFIKTIYDESLQLSDIIENLLNVLLLDNEDLSIAIEKVDLKALLEDTAAEFSQKLLSHKLGLRLEFDHGSHDIVNNRENLETIIKNILSNAIKFSSPDKEILIKTHKDEARLVISITNYGPGIPDSLKEKIFEKFSRLENSTHKLPGTGLGLFIAKKLAALHGGDIGFESRENEETTFYIYLPQVSRYEKDKFDLVQKEA